jgi:aspartyl/asparaginyl beta-hydroxylase (cupin superfamily)
LAPHYGPYNGVLRYHLGIKVPKPETQCGIVVGGQTAVKKRTWLAKGYDCFQSAWRTLEGIETMSMIRKGRVRWVTKGDVVAETRFILGLFAITT